MTTEKKVLNNMPGFKKGFQAILSLKSELNPSFDSTDEQVAFALGAIAGVYNSIDDESQLWEIRQKLWKIEEALGQGRKSKIES